MLWRFAISTRRQVSIAMQKIYYMPYAGH